MVRREKAPGLAAIVFACAALTAGMASAAENGTCYGTIFRSVSRFRGTIRSVTMLSEGGKDLSPIDFDPKFAVTIDIEGAKPQNFAIHSPSRTFGSGKLVGRTFDLVAEGLDCNDKFQRYIALWVQPRTPWIEDYEGAFEIGHSYRTKVTWEGDSMRLPKEPELPMHHSGEFIFANLPEYVSKHPGEIVFEVVSVRITNPGEQRWLSSYELKITSQ